MTESGDAALPQAIVMAASQPPGNSTAVVVRPPKPSKDQLKALLAAAPEMFKWSPARCVKLMEFLVKAAELAAASMQRQDGTPVFSQSQVNATLRQATADTTHATCLLYTSPSPRDRQKSRMPSSA